MTLAPKYQPQEVENKWYKYWMEKKFFASKPDSDKEPFTIVIPPPNVTGVLHMGHMLNNTIQDILVRKARMEGKNACWVPGTDHASIATEAKVVNKLREQGIKKSDLSREEFLNHAFEWKDKHGGIILEQLKKLGASCDWDRTAFTMDPGYSESVIDTFIDLYNKGMIYRGSRMVNWDSKALTAVSDEEVMHKEVKGKLYNVRYKVKDADAYITIATTRPETILADTAICVHPEDERYTALHGKTVIVPLCNREIPIICDEYVDREFGTGALKITPAHDVNDYELGNKHGLPIINMLNPNGTLNEEAGMYVGEDRFIVRKKIAKDLDTAGALVSIEDYENKVGYSERTDEVIEPRLSLQWFVDMKKFAGPAAKAVEEGEITFHPAKFKNTYRHWMDNIKDWCISRQLWWGHQIPAWYYGEDQFVVAKTAEEAIEKLKAQGINDIKAEDLKQDEDVLDTWFSSWLWPISTFDPELIKTGKPNEELSYYYPTNDLVTAPEIIFFWVARMIMAGYEYLGKKPFSNVYFTGIVRDKQGRKMSKSLGNSPDPIKLMEQFGADGVRVGMLYSSPAGNDLLFDESYCEQGRNFCNKVWNSLRLIEGWEKVDAEMPALNQFAIDWINTRIDEVIIQVNDHFSKYRLSDALMSIYKLVFDDYCAWYLELVKPNFGSPIDKKSYEASIQIFERLLRLMHPFMPFITEEIWHVIGERKSAEDAIIVAEWPKATAPNHDLIACFNLSSEIVGQVRNIRNKAGIPNKERLELCYTGNIDGSPNWDLVTKLAGISDLKKVDEEMSNAYSFVLAGASFFVPFSEKIDIEAEKQKIKEELTYTQGFLKSVQKKLANERFVAGAPEAVVAGERKKEQDALGKIKALESKLASL